MFNHVSTENKLSKEVYDEKVPQLRLELLQLQHELSKSNKSVLLIISGVEGSGKGALVNKLHEWMDTRSIQTQVFHALSDEEKNRPEFWRYWRVMPQAGTVGIFFGSWYTQAIIDRVHGDLSEESFNSQLHRIRFHEHMLSHNGTIIIKLWLHISKKEQKARFKKLEKDKRTAWRVSKQDWEFHKQYDSFLTISEQTIRLTDSAAAPWQVIDASDERYREVFTAEILIKALKNQLHKKPLTLDLGYSEEQNWLKSHSVISTVQFPTVKDIKAYKKEFEDVSLELQDLSWKSHQKQKSTVIVFEGWDAAGKGGAIRRVVSCMDAKFYRVIQTAAPSDEEKAHHYLWRFWRHIPRDGNVTLYDRSWYGRVMVERVEGFATVPEWKRSYFEINEFEQQLVDHGTRVVKFFLHITPEEQLARFKAREETPYKNYKITDEDWRNRDKWGQYEDAIHEMLVRTDTQHAPWHIIPSNDKRISRLMVLKALVKAMRL
ncbi:polyphosphate:AMP phosphotransferase [bacterium]|nr:MAG: polyphosphate:AMP phosphotransferase [bacterium]